VIADGISMDSKQAGWDTHGTGLDIVFKNLHTIGSRRTGFQIRSKRTRLIGCSARDCWASGLWLLGADAANDFGGDECTVSDFSCFNTN
jgi:hypothetical protein